MPHFKIVTTTDTTCPWCYIGQRRLQNAVLAWKQSHPTDTFELTYRPFIFNPSAPKPGVPKLAYFNNRFGKLQNESAQAQIRAEGAKDGINFAWERGKTGSTMDSHRLAWFANTQGEAEAADKAITNVYRGYFEEEADVTGHEFLVDCGVRAGLDAEEVKRFLKSDDGMKEVEQMAEDARRGGVGGVPSFEINGTYVLEGARESELFRRVFERISASA